MAGNLSRVAAPLSGVASKANQFDAFAESAYAGLVRAAMLILGDRGQAEDIAQETLIAVYRSWRGIRVVEAAPAYAYRTMVRLARRHARKAAREVVGVVPDTAAPEHASSDDRVRRALLGVPPRQREALVLRYFLDLSVDATAAAMGCSTGAVKSQCSKGLTAMRARLAEADEAEVRP